MLLTHREILNTQYMRMEFWLMLCTLLFHLIKSNQRLLNGRQLPAAGAISTQGSRSCPSCSPQDQDGEDGFI